MCQVDLCVMSDLSQVHSLSGLGSKIPRELPRDSFIPHFTHMQSLTHPPVPNINVSREQMPITAGLTK